MTAGGNSPELGAGITDKATAQSDSLRAVLAPYAESRPGRALFELFATAVPLALLLSALLVGERSGNFWGAVFLSPVAAGFIVRLFIIQHDCGHRAFFRSRLANDITGRLISLVTLTPYDIWRRNHAVHHATSGNLDRRGIGDIFTLTLREYRARSRWGRAAYRLYRHPLFLFGIAPALQFWILYRFPDPTGARPFEGCRSILGTNLLIAAAGCLIASTIGLGPFLLAFGPPSILAASAGVWLFFLQHYFEETYWAGESEWDFHRAAFDGSSVYDLPRLLHWMTMNISFHHIHHLNSRIPGYALRRCFAHNPMLQTVKRISLRESIAARRLALWDEDARRMIAL